MHGQQNIKNADTADHGLSQTFKVLGRLRMIRKTLKLCWWSVPDRQKSEGFKFGDCGCSAKTQCLRTYVDMKGFLILVCGTRSGSFSKYFKYILYLSSLMDLRRMAMFFHFQDTKCLSIHRFVAQFRINFLTTLPELGYHHSSFQHLLLR